MRQANCLSFIAASAILLHSCIGLAYAGNVDFFKIRTSIHHSDHSSQLDVTEKLNAASQWRIRRHYNDALSGSLLTTYPARPVQMDTELRSFIYASLEESDALHASLHTSNASHFAAQAARFRLLPTISFQAERTRSFGNLSTTAPGWYNTATLSANWVVFSSGERWSSIRASEFTALASDLNYLATERQILFQNIGTYLQLYANNKTVDAIHNTLKRLKRLRYSTYRQYQAGLTSMTDIAQIDAEIASVQSQLENARRGAKEARVLYRDIIGRAAPKRLKRPTTAHLIPATKALAVERAVNGNYYINGAYANFDAARHNANAILGQSLPQISLYADASTNNLQTNKFGQDKAWEVGVRLTIPLFNLENNALYNQARETKHAAKYQAYDVQHQVKREAETSWVQYHAYAKQEKALARQKRAIKRSLKGLKSQVEIGLRPISDLLREEIQLTSVEISRIQTELSKDISAYRLAVQFSDTGLEQFISN